MQTFEKYDFAKYHSFFQKSIRGKQSEKCGAKNCGRFHDYRNKLISGEQTLRFGTPSLVFTIVILSSLTELLTLIPA